MKLRFVIGELPEAHPAFDGEKRIKGCNCDNCAAMVKVRWEMRLEVRERQRSVHVAGVAFDA